MAAVREALSRRSTVSQSSASSNARLEFNGVHHEALILWFIRQCPLISISLGTGMLHLQSFKSPPHGQVDIRVLLHQDGRVKAHRKWCFDGVKTRAALIDSTPESKVLTAQPFNSDSLTTSCMRCQDPVRRFSRRLRYRVDQHCLSRSARRWQSSI